MKRWLPVFALLALGCNQTSTSAPDAGYLLTAEPAGALPVLAVKQSAKDGDSVVIVGRIGGEVDPWVKDRASFRIIDLSFKACNEDERCPGCNTPWDFCCDPKEELRKACAWIKVVDAPGQTVSVDARQLLGVKELQTVVVQGQAKRDSEGNLTILAKNVFVRK